MKIEEIWSSPDPVVWRQALDCYWCRLKKTAFPREIRMAALDPERVRGFNPQEWLDFLHDEYFVWKYSAANREATSRAALRRGVQKPDGLERLHRVLTRIFEVDRSDIAQALFVAKQVPGLGVAGASGLLAVLFPDDFGTVDQFVVEALRRVPTSYRPELHLMQPESLDGLGAVILISLMRAKAEELMKLWDSPFTPRMIDQVLWATRLDDGKSRKAKVAMA